MNKKEEFFSRFKFDQQKKGHIGVEREQFVTNKNGQIIPLAPLFLSSIGKDELRFNRSRMDFGYELSACQVESKIGPCVPVDLRDWLNEAEIFLQKVDSKLGVSRINTELAPEDMPLDIYPDPTGRYQIITKDMPREILSAACRVAATHVHIGMPDLLTAVSVYNRVIQEVDGLIKIGDGSCGKRMALYRIMAKRHKPEPVVTPDDFYQQAVSHDFVNDPRKCWTIIRISIHGTIEFRMFGATESVDKVVDWALRCRELCF